MDIYDFNVDNPVFAGGGYANNPGINNVSLDGKSGWISPFNAMSEVTALIVQSTTSTFDSVTGQLERSVDQLAPHPITVVDVTGTHSDLFAEAFANGGTQVTEYNTGNNPGWQVGWGDQFDYTTLTYDSQGTLWKPFYTVARPTHG